MKIVVLFDHITSTNAFLMGTSRTKFLGFCDWLAMRYWWISRFSRLLQTKRKEKWALVYFSLRGFLMRHLLCQYISQSVSQSVVLEKSGVFTSCFPNHVLVNILYSLNCKYNTTKYSLTFLHTVGDICFNYLLEIKLRLLQIRLGTMC